MRGEATFSGPSIYIVTCVVVALGISVRQCHRPASTTSLAKHRQRISYSIGVALARAFDREQSDDLEALRAGMLDELTGSSLALTEAQLRDLLREINERTVCPPPR
jgi:hypothetical protein